MAETLGSLCDKLTIVKLKQFHSHDAQRLQSLSAQQAQLQSEIDEFVAAALSGNIALERLSFAANKVFKAQGNAIPAVEGTFGEVFSRLAEVNCLLWHEQEKVYDFEAVPPHEKDAVVKQLALLNLSRNQCIDQIDHQLSSAVAGLQVAR